MYVCVCFIKVKWKTGYTPNWYKQQKRRRVTGGGKNRETKLGRFSGMVEQTDSSLALPKSFSIYIHIEPLSFAHSSFLPISRSCLYYIVFSFFFYVLYKLFPTFDAQIHLLCDGIDHKSYRFVKVDFFFLFFT